MSVIRHILTVTLFWSIVAANTSTKEDECPQELFDLVQQSRSECSEEAEISEIDENLKESATTEQLDATTKRSRQRNTTKRPRRTTKRPRRTTKRPRRTTKRPRRITKRPRRTTIRSKDGSNRTNRSTKTTDKPNQEPKIIHRQVAKEECLTDKIKAHQIGIEIIKKCEELKLIPSLLDVRILTSPEQELNQCITNAISQC